MTEVYYIVQHFRKSQNSHRIRFYMQPMGGKPKHKELYLFMDVWNHQRSQFEPPTPAL